MEFDQLWTSIVSEKIKYPRTFHLPWSPGRTEDDKTLDSIDHFRSMESIVITEKLDGENTTIYKDYTHARSIDGRHHPSRDWVKNLQYQIGWMIPEGWRICGENMYAKHSIDYSGLTNYFYVFSVWNGSQCLSWEDTIRFCEDLSLEIVPVLYRGSYPDDFSLFQDKSLYGEEQEGYVVRNAEGFNYDDFQMNVAKFVRENHVQTDKHWRQNWEKNKLVT